MPKLSIMFAPSHQVWMQNWKISTQDSCWDFPAHQCRSSDTGLVVVFVSLVGTPAVGHRTQYNRRSRSRTTNLSSCESIWQSIWNCKYFIFTNSSYSTNNIPYAGTMARICLLAEIQVFEKDGSGDADSVLGGGVGQVCGGGVGWHGHSPRHVQWQVLNTAQVEKQVSFQANLVWDNR